MCTSELLGAEHGVDEVHERRDGKQQRQHRHGNTYTPSQTSMNPSMAAKVARPSRSRRKDMASG
jgi:hypothetical protein